MTTRVVRPDRLIRWNGALWRCQRNTPDWLTAGTRVRVMHSAWRPCLRVCPPYADYLRVDFIRESEWLPEGF